MLILAKLEEVVGAAVILNGVTVYHQDDYPGYGNQGFSARRVAERLAEALKTPVAAVSLTLEECGGDEWNFDLVEKAAVARFPPVA